MPEVKGTEIPVFFDNPLGEFNDSGDLEQATLMQCVMELERAQIEIVFEFFMGSLKNRVA
jgi:hypothetical protein